MKIKEGLGSDESLELDILEDSDPAFFGGMAADNLNDPRSNDPRIDPLFKDTSVIHGIIKIAANSSDLAKSQTLVNSQLDAIKKILGHPTIIADIPARSLPSTANSRVDGQVRPAPVRGHEQ